MVQKVDTPIPDMGQMPHWFWQVYNRVNTDVIEGIFDTNVVPLTDATRSLGTSTKRWSTVYATAFSDGATATGTFLSSSGTTARFAAGSGWTALDFFTGGTSRFTINSTGNFTINSPSSGYTLTLNGAGLSLASNGATIDFVNTGSNVGQINYYGSTFMELVGRNSGMGWKLYVGNAILSTTWSSTGAVTIAAPSSGSTATVTLNVLNGAAPLKLGTHTVANLPAAGTAGAGSKAFVTDANATTFASVVVGGGANNVPVYSDGTNWRIG